MKQTEEITVKDLQKLESIPVHLEFKRKKVVIMGSE